MSYIPPVIQINTSTSNATPTVAYSVPLSTAQAVYIDINYINTTAAHTNAMSGEVKGLFYRAAGNITQGGSLVSQVINTLALSTATVTIVANTSTQKADITITGIAATTVNWTLSVAIIYVT